MLTRKISSYYEFQKRRSLAPWSRKVYDEWPGRLATEDSYSVYQNGRAIQIKLEVVGKIRYIIHNLRCIMPCYNIYCQFKFI